MAENRRWMREDASYRLLHARKGESVEAEAWLGAAAVMAQFEGALVYMYVHKWGFVPDLRTYAYTCTRTRAGGGLPGLGHGQGQAAHGPSPICPHNHHGCTYPHMIFTPEPNQPPQELELFLVNSYGDLFDLEHRFPAADEPPTGLFRCVSIHV